MAKKYVPPTAHTQDMSKFLNSLHNPEKVFKCEHKFAEDGYCIKCNKTMLQIQGESFVDKNF